jgi:hypothetical protein
MRKRGKKNKRAARAKNLGDWSSMATTNGDAKAAKSFKNQNSLAAATAAARESTKKTEIPSSDKKKVHSFIVVARFFDGGLCGFLLFVNPGAYLEIH